MLFNVPRHIWILIKSSPFIKWVNSQILPLRGAKPSAKGIFNLFKNITRYLPERVINFNIRIFCEIVALPPLINEKLLFFIIDKCLIEGGIEVVSIISV